MSIAHWVVGPQIVGLMMLLIGCIQRYFPPRHINNWYGYRTDTSKKNQQTWDEANAYSAILMIKIAIIVIITGLIMSAVISIEYELVMIMSATFTGIGFAIVIMVKTENHLEKTFDKKGNEVL